MCFAVLFFTQNVGERVLTQSQDLWKYVSFWLNNIMKMPLSKFHENVMLKMPPDFHLLKRLAAFLYGRPEWEAAMIPMKNFMLTHLVLYLHHGPENFKSKLQSVKVCDSISIVAVDKVWFDG